MRRVEGGGWEEGAAGAYVGGLGRGLEIVCVSFGDDGSFDFFRRSARGLMSASGASLDFATIVQVRTAMKPSRAQST